MQCNLTNRALVRVSGADAKEFLQNQFSNDISKLGNSNIQINAYCQHQGKIIALFWVMRSDNSFLLSFPIDLLEIVVSRLQMFVIMSDVIIEDITSSFVQLGLIKEINSNGYLINENITLSDYAIFPFIRQCAHVDLIWFKKNFEYLALWLEKLKTSELFISIMKKYDIWTEGAKDTIVKND